MLEVYLHLVMWFAFLPTVIERAVAKDDVKQPNNFDDRDILYAIIPEPVANMLKMKDSFGVVRATHWFGQTVGRHRMMKQTTHI